MSLIVRDDERQVATAESYVAEGAWVSVLALAEATWVLLQDPDVVSSALRRFRRRPSLGFSDCLLLGIAAKAGHLPLGTFDRNLARLEGATKLS